MNLFDLAARLSLNSDDYNKELDDAEDRADRSGKSIGAKLKNGIGNALKIATAAGSAAISAASAGVVKILKQSVDSYSQYEQLVGGVETLFSKSVSASDDFRKSIENDTEAIKKFQQENGLVADGIIGPKTKAAIESVYGGMVKQSKEAAEIVKKNAAEAYKTAGLSANDYMATVTSFSASLLQSLNGDTVKAANISDMAIRDMSD